MSYFDIKNMDCVEGVSDMESDSVDMAVYSPPFADVFVYSDDIRDMGNCTTHDEFMNHYGFLLREMVRVMKPGRVVAVHCSDLPSSKFKDGFIGIRDFSGDLIRAHQDAGFIYHSRVTVWKSPVTEMQRTKALGLLYKQLRKDSTMSRQGLCDYVLVFRTPGENAEPVTKTESDFPISQWQEWASPVWMDINQSNTLNVKSARHAHDERHVCPLQLDLIERCVRLWSNPGDLVLSPFTGIGSEGYVSLNCGRRFVGFELKPSYYKSAVETLRNAESTSDLFATA